MPIIIAHGQPKSGSTFLWSASLALSSIVNGQEYYAFVHERLGDEIAGFQANISASVIETVASRIDPADYVVLKTHGPFTEEMQDMVENEKVIAFTSFRDPRDTAVSTLDAGASDRKKGSTRWFTKFTDVHQLVTPIIRQFSNIVPWVECPKVFSVPYYMTAARQSTTVELLARHLGYGVLGHRLARQMDSEKTAVPEWNKGIADRFIEALEPDEIEFLNEKFAEVLPRYNEMLRQRMAALGHRMLYEYLVASREERMSAKLREPAA